MFALLGLFAFLGAPLQAFSETVRHLNAHHAIEMTWEDSSDVVSEADPLPECQSWDMLAVPAYRAPVVQVHSLYTVASRVSHSIRLYDFFSTPPPTLIRSL